MALKLLVVPDLERVRVRAFFLWENQTGRMWWDPDQNWTEAYEHEAALVNPRSVTTMPRPPQPPPMDFLYRLRSIDALVSKFHELEEQEIYLSPPERLNDPMEGYKDVFWDGDETLWENLLGHYLLSLVWATMYCLVATDDAFAPPEFQAELSEERLPSDTAREIFHDIRRRFFSDAATQAIPKALTSLRIPLRAHGLRLILSGLHTAACKAVFDELTQRHMVPPGQFGGLPQTTMVGDLIQKLSADVASPQERANLVEGLGFAATHASEVQVLRAFNTAAPGSKLGSLKKNLFLLMEFPAWYVQAIGDRMTHMKWYTACFTATCVNASMWSVYADEHRGAALMFKPKLDAAGAPTLTLNMVSGMSYAPSVPNGLPSMGRFETPLHPVRYTSKAPELDFFQSLGRLTRYQLDRQWYTNQAGVTSSRLERIRSDTDEWRNGYWKSMIDVASTKLEDWKHEQEYRIIAPDALGLRHDYPKVRFEFDQLAGIVFGMKTSLADRLAIIEIVRKKCEPTRRDDFIFKQVVYLPKDGRLAVV